MSNLRILPQRIGTLLQTYVSCTCPLTRLHQPVSTEGTAPMSPPSQCNTATRSTKETSNTDSAISDGNNVAEKVVNLMNEASVENLSEVKYVSSNIAASIVTHREENGPFASAQDLLMVPGIGRQRLAQICKDITKPASLFIDAETNGVSRSTSARDYLGLTANGLESLQDVVAIDIGLKHLSWVHMSRDRYVREWTARNISEVTPGKWDPPAYLQVIRREISRMPTPSLYILQHKSYTAADKNTFKMILFQRTLEAMLYTALNNASPSPLRGAISMSQSQIGRHFNLQVKGNRMSGQSIVTDILQGSELGLDEDVGGGGGPLLARVSQPEDIETFHSAAKHEREHLSNCLLLAVAFYDLMVDGRH